MSEGNLAAAEIHEREAAPHIVKKRRIRFPFLAGAFVLIALAALGIRWWPSGTQSIQLHSDKAAEMTVTVVHPKKASITIPVLPGRTEAYTDAPIVAGNLIQLLFNGKLSPPCCATLKLPSLRSHLLNIFTRAVR